MKRIKKICQVAPVKTTPAPVKTTPSPDKPTETPRSPFNPPRPWIDPKPKGKKKTKEVVGDITLSSIKSFEYIVRCAQNYEREAHPSVRGFWSNIPQEHPFSQHPTLVKHGPKLSEEGFEFSRNTLSEGGNEPTTNVMKMTQEVMELMGQISKLEAEHEEELIEMAKDITVEIWGIDKSMLEGKIQEGHGEMEQDDGGEPQEEGNLLEVTPELRDLINKRITSNLLTQGASVHAMASVHHLVAEKIRQISPELLSLYTRMSGLATHQYYAIDIPKILAMIGNLSQAGVGWSKVQWQKEDEGGEAFPKVVAQGICFPVLCQEMFKGVMEMISMHGFGREDLTQDELYTVYHYADRLEDEPWQITVGPALWRKFVAVLPKNISMAGVVQKLSMKSPKEMNDIINSVIEDPNRAKQTLQGFAEPEVKEQYTDEDNKLSDELVVPPETFEGLEDIFPDKDRPKKNKKDKGAGEIVVPKETFEGLEDIFNKSNQKNKKS